LGTATSSWDIAKEKKDNCMNKKILIVLKQTYNLS